MPDPALKNSYAHQTAIGFDRLLATDFAVSVNSGAEVCIRVVHCGGGNGISSTPNARRIISDVLTNGAIVVDGDGPVVRPTFTHCA